MPTRHKPARRGRRANDPAAAAAVPAAPVEDPGSDPNNDPGSDPNNDPGSGPNDDPVDAPFADRLLAWWDRHGRKHLPWQQPRTAYRVWISEIMLQQTQVATVIPYFARWMQRFPEVGSLARAPLDEVLAHWSGLGYYARARNLHRAARECQDRFGGALPESGEALVSLPGIGISTANAIVSQALDRPAAVLDGNVRRVLARHALIEEWPGAAAAQRALWREAELRLPASRGADYTQAIMDLGALVCTRSRPDCDHCPVRADCRALAAGAVARLPARKPAARVGERTVFLLILRDGKGRVLLERRPPAGIWGGLWSLPEAETLRALETALGIRIDDAERLPPRAHRLSHLRLSLHPIHTRTARAGQVKYSNQQRWFDPAEHARLGLPQPVAELLRTLDNGGPE